MILPVGTPDGPQVLVLFRRNSAGEFERQELWQVRFVPLL
jgi:protein-L-isoaspartate O-methyltransferase